MSTNSKNFSNSFSLTDEIADVVRERILKGEYEIGEKIKENQIFDSKDLLTIGNSVSYPMWLEYMMEFTKHQTIKMRELCFSLLKI